MNILKHGLQLFERFPLRKLITAQVQSSQECPFGHLEIPVEGKLFPDKLDMRVRHEVYEQTEKGLRCA